MAATLDDVVLELQEQNRSMDDVSADIRALVRESEAARKEAERAKGKELENEREAKKAARPVASKPTTFTGGVAQGLGLTGLMDIAKSALAPFLGTLGGFSLGALLGNAVAGLFKASIGYVLGENFLRPFWDKYVPQWIKDQKLFDFMGKEITIDTIGPGIAGALGLLFGPKLIKGAVGFVFRGLSDSLLTLIGKQPIPELTEAEKKSVGRRSKNWARRFRRGLIGRMAIGGFLYLVGEEVGNQVSKYTGSEEMGDAVAKSMNWAAVGALFFGVKGAIALAIAGLAVSGLKWIGDWLSKRDQEVRDAAYKNLEKYKDMTPEQLAAMSDEEAKTFREDVSRARQEADRATQMMLSEGEKKRAAEIQQAADRLAADAGGRQNLGAMAKLAMQGDDNALTKLVDTMRSMGYTSEDGAQEALYLAGQGGATFAEQQEFSNLVSSLLGSSGSRTRGSGGLRRRRALRKEMGEFLYNLDANRDGSLDFSELKGVNSQQLARAISRQKNISVTDAMSLISGATGGPEAKRAPINIVDNSSTVTSAGGSANYFMGGGVSSARDETVYPLP